jgi:large subunit ribosomal protein L1
MENNMAKLSKRMKAIRAAIDPNRQYAMNDALALLKEHATAKFKENIDIAVNLGVDPRKSDQVVRGATLLPKGTGRTVRVAVFAQGEQATVATEAGADIVGFDDLAAEIKSGTMNFDVLIATPDAMKLVGQLGQVLGPRGLMPNPKVGTVTADVKTAVTNAKAGQVRYRTDKAGIIHCSVGKAEFSIEDLKENIEALLVDLKKAKPVTSKGVYIKKVALSTTMGPGIAIDKTSIEV